jgi:hypothetical protein
MGVLPLWVQKSAASTDETTLSLAGRTIVLEPSRSAGGSASDTVNFRIVGPTAQTIDVELLDLVVDSSGARTILPFGSTAHTLDEVVTVGPFPARYVPGGTRQNFSVTLTANAPLDDVRFGGVRVSIAPDTGSPSGTSLDNVSGILLTVLVVPEGFDGNLPLLGETALAASSLSVTPTYVENFFETLLPDIPGVVNRGPLALSVDFVNESPHPFFLNAEWSLSSNGEALLVTSADRTLMFAGQAAEKRMKTAVEIPGSTRTVDVLPAFGVVNVLVSGEARLGQAILDTTESRQSFLVLRWKEPFALGLALALIVFLLVASRRTAAETDTGETPAEP